MRLVNFEEFCRMPAGTIFAPYEPCVLKNPLAIKVDEGRDALVPRSGKIREEHWFNGVMILEPSFDSLECGLWEYGDKEEASFEVYDGDNTDYEEYKLFLVFEEPDVDKMIAVLNWAKNGCKEDVNFSNY